MISNVQFLCPIFKKLEKAEIIIIPYRITNNLSCNQHKLSKDLATSTKYKKTTTKTQKRLQRRFPGLTRLIR